MPAITVGAFFSAAPAPAESLLRNIGIKDRFAPEGDQPAGRQNPLNQRSQALLENREHVRELFGGNGVRGKCP
jgi:hypothetical protein